jgi:hypothetical protein
VLYVGPVIFLRTSRLYLLTSVFALFAFGGDIVADALADACRDHCVAETSQSDTSHEKAPCSHCSCAVHNGFAVASITTVSINDGSDGSLFIFTDNQSAPAKLPKAIDHPPQLA